MRTGGHNPRSNVAPFGRYTNGVGFPQGRNGVNVPSYQPSAPHSETMTKQQRNEILLAAGRFVVECLVSRGDLPPQVLQSRQPAQPLPRFNQPPPPLSRPFHEAPLANQWFHHQQQAPRPFQRQFKPRPFQQQHTIAKRPLRKFQGCPRFPPPSVAAPKTTGELGQGEAPGAGCDAAAGPSSSRHPSPQSGDAAQVLQETEMDPSGEDSTLKAVQD